MNCSYCKIRLPKLFLVQLVFTLLQRHKKKFVGQHFLNIGYSIAVSSYVNGQQILSLMQSESVTSILIILMANRIFTYRELGAIHGKQRLLYQGIAEWNSLDKSMRDMRSLLVFKQVLKTANILLVFIL